MVQIKLINRSENPDPFYATSLAAGMDMYAANEEPIELPPLRRAMIPTGIYIELPEGYEAQIRPRSGLAWKHGLTVLNSPGTIDADYRGEIRILLINLGADSITISKGDRIAQMVIASHEKVKWQSVELLTETARGAGGFGHTGH